MTSARFIPPDCVFGIALGGLLVAFFGGIEGTAKLLFATRLASVSGVDAVGALDAASTRTPLRGILSFGVAAKGVRGLFDGGTGALIDRPLCGFVTLMAGNTGGVSMTGVGGR